MAIICSICGKKQSGWLVEYPMQGDFFDYKMCAECGERYEKVARTEDKTTVSTEIAYLKEKMIGNANGINGEVNEYLLKLFEEDNTKTAKEVQKEIAMQKEEKKQAIMITSGFDFQGYRIVKYCDYIIGQRVLGLGAFKSLFAAVSNLTGTESASLYNKIEEAKNLAMDELRSKAAVINANAIIGVDIDFTMFADSMIAVIANGTAVVVEKEQ